MGKGCITANLAGEMVKLIFLLPFFELKEFRMSFSHALVFEIFFFYKRRKSQCPCLMHLDLKLEKTLKIRFLIAYAPASWGFTPWSHPGQSSGSIGTIQ
jgi:hypothetical protein